ncbi:MAG: hypothetical protein WBH52_11635 [Pseudomonas aeruginosa]
MSKQAQNAATTNGYKVSTATGDINKGQPYTRFSVALKAAKAEMAKGNAVTFEPVKVRVTRVATVETA